MTTKEIMQEEYLKNARRIFSDSENYTEKQLLGYHEIFDEIARFYYEKDVFLIEDNSEKISELETDIEGLDEKWREVIRLSYLEGYSLAKIAEELSCPRRMVGRILVLATRKLVYVRKYDERMKTELIIKNQKIKKKAKFLEYIKSGIIPDFDIELEYFDFYLNLDEKYWRMLSRLKVSTILEFLSLKKADIEKIHGMGPMKSQSFLELQQKFLRGEME